MDSWFESSQQKKTEAPNPLDKLTGIGNGDQRSSSGDDLTLAEALRTVGMGIATRGQDIANVVAPVQSKEEDELHFEGEKPAKVTAKANPLDRLSEKPTRATGSGGGGGGGGGGDGDLTLTGALKTVTGGWWGGITSFVEKATAPDDSAEESEEPLTFYRRDGAELSPGKTEQRQEGERPAVVPRDDEKQKGVAVVVVEEEEELEEEDVEEGGEKEKEKEEKAEGKDRAEAVQNDKAVSEEEEAPPLPPALQADASPHSPPPPPLSTTVPPPPPSPPPLPDAPSPSADVTPRKTRTRWHPKKN